MRRVKAKLELNLATEVKDNKKGVSKSIGSDRRAKCLHPLLDVEGSTVSRGGGKAEVPNVSFPQSLIPKPQDTQLPWLEVSYGEMNETSQILKERVFPKSLGPGGCTVGWVKRWCLDVAPGDEV